MKSLNMTALTLVIIGAINWGLVGFFNVDLVATLFGGMHSAISRIIYAIIGIAGLWTIYATLAMPQEHAPRTA